MPLLEPDRDVGRKAASTGDRTQGERPFRRKGFTKLRGNCVKGRRKLGVKRRSEPERRRGLILRKWVVVYESRTSDTRFVTRPAMRTSPLALSRDGRTSNER